MADPFLGQDVYDDIPSAAPQSGSSAYFDNMRGAIRAPRTDAASVAFLLIATYAGVWAFHALGFRAAIGVGR